MNSAWSTAISMVVFGVIVTVLTVVSVVVDGDPPEFLIINPLICGIAAWIAFGVHYERQADNAKPVVYRVVVRQAPMPPLPPLPPDPRRVPSPDAGRAWTEELRPTGRHRRTAGGPQ